jgi:hypothetical protein
LHGSNTALRHAYRPSEIFSILFQAYPTVLFSYGIWNSLLKKYPMSMVAPLSPLVPILGMPRSVLIFGEHPRVMKLLAALFIVLGLVTGLYGRQLSGVLTGRHSRVSECPPLNRGRTRDSRLPGTAATRESEPWLSSRRGSFNETA